MKYIDADKKTVKEMMDSLDKKIAKATKSWKGVDVDKFMDEMRGREPDMDLEEAAKQFVGYDMDTDDLRDYEVGISAFIAGAKWQYQKDRGEFAKLKAKEWQDGYDDGYKRGLNARKEK